MSRRNGNRNRVSGHQNRQNARFVDRPPGPSVLQHRLPIQRPQTVFSGLQTEEARQPQNHNQGLHQARQQPEQSNQARASGNQAGLNFPSGSPNRRRPNSENQNQMRAPFGPGMGGPTPARVPPRPGAVTILGRPQSAQSQAMAAIQRPFDQSINNSIGLQTVVQDQSQLDQLQRMQSNSEQQNQGFQILQEPTVEQQQLQQQQPEQQESQNKQTVEVLKPNVSELEEVWDPNHWSAGLNCSVCFEPYSESYVLVCGHTWCSGCLNSMVTLAHKRAPRRPLESVTVTCPTCRRSQPHGQYARHSPRNRTLESVVEAWMKSEDRRALLTPKIDRGCQTAEDKSADQSDKAMITHQAVQTEQWPPPKAASISVGQQVALPAPGASVSIQTTPPSLRDVHIQTSNIKTRVKQTQTWFVKTRTSGVQVGTPWESAVFAALTSETQSKEYATPQNSAVGTTDQDATDSEANPASSPVLPKFAQARSDTAITKRLILDMPRPPPMTESVTQTDSTRVRQRHRASQTTVTHSSRSWYSVLEDSLGTDMADVAECFLHGDVWAVLLFVFLVVVDWRHLVSAFVTDVSIDQGSGYTMYTLKVLTHTAVLALWGSLCFGAAMFYLIREASYHFARSFKYKPPLQVK